MKFETTEEIPAYILGLWLGDKYWWGSSIGLINTNPSIIQKFRKFFELLKFEKKRIKLSVYTQNGKANKERLTKIFNIPKRNIKTYKWKKGRKTTYIIYVNSRPLKRKFEEYVKNLENLINKKNLPQYIAGRLDADGHYAKSKNRIRIGYTTEEETRRDSKIIFKIMRKNPKISFYSKANEWILELSGKKWEPFIRNIIRFSIVHK